MIKGLIVLILVGMFLVNLFSSGDSKEDWRMK